MKKIDQGAKFLAQHTELFECLACHQPYVKVVGHSLICPQGHNIDLSKKGTLNFLQHRVKSEYQHSVLEARKEVIEAGLFDGFLEPIAEKLAQRRRGGNILDVGCGEGTPLARVAQKAPAHTYLGFDIAKEGIALAAQLPTAAFFCVADLTQLPFSEQQFDTILNIFSPSAYHEFARILKPTGQVFKIVPNQNYLLELRQKLYATTPEKIAYDNSPMISRFKENYAKVTQERVVTHFNLEPTIYRRLVQMSPLQWGASPEIRKQVQDDFVNSVTVDVTLLVGEGAL